MKHLPFLAVTIVVAVFASLAPGVVGQGDGCPLSFTAVADATGAVHFHWSGFGGADGYQVFGHLDRANTAGYSPMLNGDARDYTRTDIANGTYTFWVHAYHSGMIVATSCERTAQVGPGGANVPVFPGTGAAWLAAVGGMVGAFVALRRRAS
jgi:hypothetical protein